MYGEFLKVNVLGTLTIDEVFFFYDEPQVFSAVSKFGQKYLCILIDMDDKEWNLLPVSSAQLALLKANKISVRYAFENSEDGFIWKIKENKKLPLAEAIQLYCKDIDEDDLPEDDVFLDYTEDRLMPSIDEQIESDALNERRDIIDISFLPYNKHIRELDCEVLGEALVNVQQLIYTLPLAKDYLGNKIPSQIKEENAVATTGAYAASFGVRFKSLELANIYGETTVSGALKLLAQLLESKDNASVLKEILKNHSPKTTLRYKRLMQGLLKADLSVKISIASPNRYLFKTQFTKQDIENNIRFLEEEIKDMVLSEEILGTMVGINVDKKTFAFKSVEDENIIGKLSDTFNGVTFEVPKFVKAKFEKKIVWNESTQKEKCSYTLMNIEHDLKDTKRS